MNAVRINSSPVKGEVGRGVGLSGGYFVDQTAVRAPSRPIANVAFATFPLKARGRTFMRLPCTGFRDYCSGPLMFESLTSAKATEGSVESGV